MNKKSNHLSSEINNFLFFSAKKQWKNFVFSSPTFFLNRNKSFCWINEMRLYFHHLPGAIGTFRIMFLPQPNKDPLAHFLHMKEVEVHEKTKHPILIYCQNMQFPKEDIPLCVSYFLRVGWQNSKTEFKRLWEK